MTRPLPTLQAAIELCGVDRRRGRHRVLRDLTWQAPAGVAVVLGPNGAGKTTLLRLLATVDVPSKGTIRLLGHDIGEHEGRLALRRTLGYAPQSPTLYPGFTVVEALDYVAVLKQLGPDDARADAVRGVTGRCDLGRLAGRRLGRLSAGDHRRVVLAQALLGNPQLLILDEPMTDLDAEQRGRFRQLLAELPPTTAVVAATHRPDDLGNLAGTVVTITDGTVRPAGSDEGAPT